MKSVGKEMATVLWDHKDVMLVEFMQQGTIINVGVFLLGLAINGSEYMTCKLILGQPTMPRAQNCDTPCHAPCM